MKFRDVLYEVLTILAPGYKALTSRKLKVLAYHDICDPNIFEKQIKYLKEEYNLISISTLRSHLFEDIPLPHNSLLITFDDGDVSVLKEGLPILVKNNIPACMFIITGLIDTSLDFWWRRVRIQEEENGKSHIEVQEIINKLKRISNADRVNQMAKYFPTEKQQLTLEDLKLFQRNYITIANHSHTHPMLDKCTEEEIRSEIKKAKGYLIDKGIGEYDVFAYPNGNFDLKSETILKNYDIKMAFLFDHKINGNKINPMRISRIRVDSDTRLGEFKVKVSGLHSLIYN